MIDEFSAECLIRFHSRRGSAREAGNISMLFQLIENLHAKGVNKIDGLVAGTNSDTKGEFNQSKLEQKKLYPENHLEIPSDSGVPFVATLQLST